MDDHQDFFLPTDMAPTLGPCAYVTVHNPNPLPLPFNSWDEESLSGYDFPEWEEHAEVEVTKPKNTSNNNNNEDVGEDGTEYTAGTDDDDQDDISERSEPLHELVVYRRRSSSSLSASIHSRTLIRSHSMTQIPCTVVSSGLSKFLKDRLHTITANLEFLTAFKDNAEELVGASRRNGGEDESGGLHNRQVARVNPLAQFMRARLSTFQANVEILPLLLTEQLEACLRMDRCEEEGDTCACS